MIWYLFRHGTTFFSKFGIPYGPFVRSASILPEGRQQAKEIGQQLKTFQIDAFFTSPYKRCIETTDIISQIINHKFLPDPRLREQEIIPKRESFSDLTERLNSFIIEVKDRHFRSVAVCSHGWPLGILIALLRTGQATKADLKNPPTGEIIKIQI
jgi:broad specificity phosphatase PhoE